jgi:hypothetical protein
MVKVGYNATHKKVLDSLLLKIPIVKSGKMFGYPAYYVDKKLFACVYGDAVGVKVPEVLATKLLQRDDITYFQPLGRRRMREWIQIEKDRSMDYSNDSDIFFASIEYVASLQHIDFHKDE